MPQRKRNRKFKGSTWSLPRESPTDGNKRGYPPGRHREKVALSTSDGHSSNTACPEMPKENADDFSQRQPGRLPPHRILT